MKKIFNVLILSMFFLVGMSCDDLLDNYIDTQLKPEQVFVNYGRMEEAAIGAYTYVQATSGFYIWGQSLKACATDEAEEVSYSSYSQKFNLGTWNQYSNPDNVYTKMYKGIGQCNSFIENTVNYKSILAVDTITSAGKSTYIQQCSNIEWYRYEMHFLRAYFYFELIKRYGGVPLITKTITEKEALSIPRASYEECVEFIVHECDSIKDFVQLDWEANGFPEYHGRATKGAVLALKSKVLLYAASPQNNELNNMKKWEKAAEAAKELIELKKKGSTSIAMYKLSNSYTNLFVAPSSYTDSEVIFYVRHANSNILEAWNYPIGTPGSVNGGVSPSQNLVDAYERLSNWSADNPYNRIDPRMQMTIAVNNSTWNGRTVESYEGGIDGIDKIGASRTGYYLKKFLSPNLTLTGATPGRSMKAWIVFRYAEVLLNYAEALNEVYGPEGLGDEFSLTAIDALNQVRRRTGVNLTRITSGISQKDFRYLVKNERRVELAFEEHRAWDLRRWKEGDVLAEPIRGAKIIKNGDSTFSYDFNHLVETRVFEEKMYLYPIPQSEINKYSGVLIQNPLW